MGFLYDRKKVHFCQMANMLTFCRLVDVYIFWKILKIYGKLREFFSTALVDTMDTFYTLFCSIFSQPVKIKILPSASIILIRKSDSIHRTFLFKYDVANSTFWWFNPFMPTVPPFAVRETASLGIMGEPRVPPLNPSETIVLSEHYRL